MALPDIPRLYTALAEWLAVVLYAQSRPPRFARKITLAASGMLAVMLGVFLEATGEVPIAWWVPCMGIAVGMQYLYRGKKTGWKQPTTAPAASFWPNLRPASSGSCTAPFFRSTAGESRWRCSCCCWSTAVCSG